MERAEKPSLVVSPSIPVSEPVTIPCVLWADVYEVYFEGSDAPDDVRFFVVFVVKDVFDRVHGPHVLLASPLVACASGVSEDCVSTLKKYGLSGRKYLIEVMRQLACCMGFVLMCAQHVEGPSLSHPRVRRRAQQQSIALRKKAATPSSTVSVQASKL